VGNVSPNEGVSLQVGKGHSLIDGCCLLAVTNYHAQNLLFDNFSPFKRKGSVMIFLFAGKVGADQGVQSFSWEQVSSKSMITIAA